MALRTVWVWSNSEKSPTILTQRELILQAVPVKMWKSPWKLEVTSKHFP